MNEYIITYNGIYSTNNIFTIEAETIMGAIKVFHTHSQMIGNAKITFHEDCIKSITCVKKDYSQKQGI